MLEQQRAIVEAQVYRVEKKSYFQATARLGRAIVEARVCKIILSGNSQPGGAIAEARVCRVEVKSYF